MPIIKPDALSQTLMFVILQDSGGTNPGEPATGLDNTDITSAYYVRDREAATTISVSALATPTSAYSSGGFKEIDGTNLPGLYRFDIPNAAVAFGTTVGRVIVQLNMNAASNAIAAPIEIDLDVPKAVWDDLRSRHRSAFTLGESIDALTPTRGIAEPSGASPTVFNTNLTETIDDFWNGAILVFTAGTLDGQARQVVDYDGSTKDVTVNPGFTSAPPASDAFVLISSAGVLNVNKLTVSTVVDASATSTLFVTGLTETVTDFWKGQVLVLTDGALKGQARRITAYNGGTKAVTVSPAFTAAPANGVAFDIVVADGAIRDETIVELAAVPAANAGFETMVKFIYMALRNKIITDSTAGNTKIHDDGGTAIATATIADSGTAYTRGEYS